MTTLSPNEYLINGQLVVQLMDDNLTLHDKIKELDAEIGVLGERIDFFKSRPAALYPLSGGEMAELHSHRQLKLIETWEALTGEDWRG